MVSLSTFQGSGPALLATLSISPRVVQASQRSPSRQIAGVPSVWLPHCQVSISQQPLNRRERSTYMPLYRPCHFILSESWRQILPLSISQMRQGALRGQVLAPGHTAVQCQSQIPNPGYMTPSIYQLCSLASLLSSHEPKAPGSWHHLGNRSRALTWATL